MSAQFTTSQENAIAARGNVLVVAGAGTGKTSTLVQRCIALLEQGCSLENILMVTFTEAAAVEMRGRIREALQAKLIALQSASSVPEQLDHFQKQIALLDSALISTLHSFCMQLVREHFYELGIDPDVSVLDEQQTRPLIQQILDRIFESHYAGQSDWNWAVQQLVRLQGRGSDDRIRALMLKLHRYAQSLAKPDRWLGEQQAMFEQPEPVQWREWLVTGFIEWRSRWLPALQPHAATAAVALSIQALERASTAPMLPEIGLALQTIQAANLEDKNWPRGTKTTIRAALKSFFEETEFLSSIAPRDGADPLAEDWELVRHEMLALLHLTQEFGGEFSRAKRDMGGVDFSDLEQFALRVLRHPETGATTAAAALWQTRLEHVFVDEYQDINAAQDAILSAVSREGNAANRFLVGDVKQSIYRFRLANPGIFRRYERDWSGGEFASRISLADNFRSREAILDFVNPFFSALMRDQIGGVGYEPLTFGNPEGRTPLSSGSEQAARVELHLIARSEDDNAAANGDNAEPSEVADLLVTEREARLVGLRLRQLHREQHAIWDKGEKRFRPVQWRDMAVLLRSPASRVEAFAKEFSALGIPVEAARGGFFESPEVSDLVSLLKLLDNPLQDVPLLAVLHSPLVGMSLVELAEIRASENPSSRMKCFYRAAQRFWTGNRKCENPGSAASNDQPARADAAWQKLDRFFAQLNRWRELVRQSSLSHCLETALAETQYEFLLRAQHRGEQQLANVRRLLELAREYDPYQRQGLFRFLRFIRAQEETPTELDPAGAVRDAVQLTSIHRSKGLEFPVVVIAGMGWKFNERDLHENILLDEHFGLCPKVSPPESDQHYPSLPYWLARRRQRRELLGEELRLLYVAMTRARDTLLLVGTSSRKGGGNWEPEAPRPLSDEEVLRARNYLDWLRVWLPQKTHSQDWISDREGKTPLLCWHVYDETDARLALPEERNQEGGLPADDIAPLSEAALLQIRARVRWQYPFAAATVQQAKTSVTELRRGQAEEEAQPARFAQRSAFVLPGARQGKLSAAEVGVAHHEFLQRLTLSSAGTVAALRSESVRLRDEGWLTEAKARMLDLESVASFWMTTLGKEIAANPAAVHREYPFTAGLNANDLAALKLEPRSGLPADEVVVVQGVVDLAVILEKEIWIVDFKTDTVTELELAAKVRTYQPQLQLYALALSRIYQRPTTKCALYFLATRTVAEVG